MQNTANNLIQDFRGRAVVHRRYCNEFRKAGRHATAEWHAGKALAFDVAADSLESMLRQNKKVAA